MVAVPLAHADDAVSHVRIVRLSFVEGDVAFQSPGSTWQRAMANLPIRQGFSLRTDAGYAEVEFESGLIVHLAANTQLEFIQLTLNDGLRVTSLKLDHGTMIATANLHKGDQATIASGNAEVIVPRNGRLRIDSVDSQNWVTAFKGRVEVRTGENTTLVENGKALHYGPATQGGAAIGEANQLSVDRSPRTDAFDKWAAQREGAQQEAQAGAGDFVRQRDYTFSTADLYNYGLWSNISGYGMGWQPYGMGAGWMPFANGLWMFDDMTDDWMWTSFEPWGWMPYHFGGWVDIAGAGWFWIPQSPRTFRAATASFVTVGNQVGWTPTLATPTNPTKVKPGVAGPTQIVFAGGAQNGVIIAGPRGHLAPSTTVNSGSGPASTFVQRGQPTMSALAASGVVATGRAPVMPMSTALTYTAHGTINGTANGTPTRTANGNGSATNGPRGNLGAANLGAPGASGRPVAMAPHTAPVQVQHPPSTFANVNTGGRNSGVTPVNNGMNTGGSFGGIHSTAGVSGGSGAPGGSNGSGGAGHSTGAGSSGGTAPAGGAAGGGVAPGGTGSVKH
jgi:hypothetical protein